MYTSNLKLASFFVSFLSLAAVVTAQKNITVPVSDPNIQYSGSGTGVASICQVNSDGQVVGGQGGCYNLATKCTDSMAAGQSLDSAASFKFKGSAIYITGLLYSISPVYTVTLDGTSTDVDGVRDSGPFICSPLFSVTNLDPNAEHTIRLSVKGPSPNRNTTIDPTGKATVFGLVNLIYTVPDTSASQTSKSIDPSSPTSAGLSASPSTNSGDRLGLHTFSSLLGAVSLSFVFNYLSF